MINQNYLRDYQRIMVFLKFANETKKFEIKENEQIDNKPNLNENVSKISDISKNEGKLATNEINNFVEENANNKKENKISNNLEKGIDKDSKEQEKTNDMYKLYIKYKKFSIDDPQKNKFHKY